MQVIHEFKHKPRVRQHRAPRKGDAEWAVHRPLIEDLYLVQNLPLKKVVKHMASLGFVATHRQYEYHLALWKASKYTPKSTPSSLPSRSPQMSVPHDDLARDQTARHSADPLLNSTVHVSNSADAEWLDSFEAPMLNWDHVSLFIEQELAALNEKEAPVPAPVDIARNATPPLTQFAGCQFVEQDHADVPGQRVEAPSTGELPVLSEHHWQTPSSLSRLWEVEMPPSQRTLEQHYRVQKLIWCLWLCGNHQCFTSIARAAQYRIIRVEDDVSRFEASIEKWIQTSLGYPKSMLSPSRFAQTTSRTESTDDPTSFVSDSVLRQREDGIGDWNLHAKLGHHLAMLKATRQATQARKLRFRLRSELSSSPGQWGFCSSFANVINLLQRILVRELSHMHALETDVRKFINVVLGDSLLTSATDGNLSNDQKAVGVLSFLCYQRWKQSPAFSTEAEALIETRTGFPIAKAFQWSVRMMLFYSSGDKFGKSTSGQISITSLAPSALCSKALTGLSAMALFDKEESSSSRPLNITELDGEHLATVWLNWLARDSAWFLPSLLPLDVSETSMNIWQSIIK